MKNLKKVAVQTAPQKWMPLYYSIEKDAVYTEDGEGRYLVTYLINKNTEDDIRDAVNRWKWM